MSKENNMRQCPWCKSSAISPLFHARSCYINFLDDFRVTGVVPSAEDTLRAWNNRAGDWILEADKPFVKEDYLEGQEILIQPSSSVEVFKTLVVGKDKTVDPIYRYAVYSLSE